METLINSNWNYPTNIIFGNGRISELASLCLSINIHKPLIVTDEGLANFEFIKNIQSNLKACALFSQVKANPNGENIAAGVKVYHEGQHDGIIAIGGGSALDAGKAIALMVGQSLDIWAFEDVGNHYLHVNEAGMAPVIAIPTTAGTGSEVGRASVIVDESTHTKKVIFHPNMLPQKVILDPELSQGLPAHITAATGIDAFVHCFEAFCAPGYHPMADGIAVQGMLLVKQWLPVAYLNGKNLTARGYMLTASTMGATAFQKGLGGVHALAHPLGAIYDKHHGLLNAILLPYVVLANRPAIEDKIQYLCGALELGNHGLNSFHVFFDWLMGFRAELGIPKNLAEIGIDTKRAEEISLLAVADPSASGNPVAFGVKSYEAILIDAVNGKIEL